MPATAAPGALQAQLDTLRQELLRSRNSITASKIRDELRGRVAGQFDIVLGRLDKRHAELIRALQTSQPFDATWRQLGKLQEDAARTFGECLALIEGALARERNVDEGVCALADGLLDDLAASSDISWGRFTLLGTSELYRETAGIIHVRFPELSLWSLPLAAHEFGHFIGPELRDGGEGQFTYPFQDRSKAADQGRTQPFHTKSWHHLQEQFADLYATYTLGPAFAMAFITLRMNPTSDETGTHPSGARRVHGILWALEQLDEQRGATMLGTPFIDTAARLRECWEESRRVANQPDKLSGAEASLVTERMSELWEMLSGLTPERLRYKRTDWRQAELVADSMREAADGTATACQAIENITRRDVLNGMWLARLLAPPNDVRVLNEFARLAGTWYKQIAAEPRQTALPKDS